MKFKLYYHTLKRLKLRQIVHQVAHKIVPPSVRNKKVAWRSAIQKQSHGLELIPYIEKPTGYLGKNTFTFLNLDADFAGWEDKRQGALWLYNLNYMDFLL